MSNASTHPSLPSVRNDVASLGASISRFLDQEFEEMRACSEDIYRNPELSGEEYRSSAKLADVAALHGFDVEMGVGDLPTAFRAIKSGGLGTDGPTVCFLAEYDALPTVGHGCGHNFIGTASTYAALALGAASSGFKGRVVLMGTPAEETDGGKIDLQRAGLFEGVDVAMMVHPAGETDARTVSLALIPVRVRFHGRPAHAAAKPWDGLNALDALIQFFVMLDHMRKQFPTHVRIPGIITKGGVRSNIVPELTEAEFSVRSTTRAELELVFARFLQCGQAAALATGCRFEYEEFGNRYHEMRTNDPMADRFHQHWKELGGVVESAARKDFGSIDIGNLSHDFPCIHPRVKTCAPHVAGHTVEFGDATITEDGHRQLRRSAETMARVGLDYLLDASFREQVKADFAKG